MIKLIIPLLLSCQLFASTHHVPKNGTDQGPDIPLVGSSLFDKVFSQTTALGKVIYNLPYPIGRLMQKVSGSSEFSTVHTMLPFSRSLQRPTGLDYKPLENPRLVFSFKNSDTWLERSKIFIGHVKKTDQLEVISYNDEAGRFEYQLVTNYSTNPKVYYVNRGKCLSCHQGQAPIFSVSSWDDTNNGILGDILAAKHNIKNPHTPSSKKKLMEKIFGENKSLDAVGNFDFLVREANDIALNERVWTIGCGKNNECRLGLLLKTLAPNSKLTDKYYNISIQTIKNSDLSSQKTFSSFLSSTNLDAIKIAMRYAREGSGKSLYENVAQNENAILEFIQKIYNLDEKDNPATKRERAFSEDQLFITSLATFNFNDHQVLKSEFKSLDEEILKLYQNKEILFSQKAINKPLIMGFLLESSNPKVANTYLKYLDKKTPKKEIFKGKRTPVFKQKELNVFSRYCSQCHGQGLIYPPQFLVGDEQTVKNKIKLMKERILFKLENNLMPPSYKDREFMKASGDQDLLIKYLEEFK